jgi:hypothetical protein
MTWYATLVPGSESGLRDAIYNMGPVSACIDASYWSFQQYSGGVYDEAGCSSSSPDHAVCVIGLDAADKWWIVKNSWAPIGVNEGTFAWSRVIGVVLLIIREPESDRPGRPVEVFRIQQLERLPNNLRPRRRPVARLEEAADVAAMIPCSAAPAIAVRSV